MDTGLSSKRRLVKGARLPHDVSPSGQRPRTAAEIAKLLRRGAEWLALGFVLLALGPVILSLHAARLFHECFLADGDSAAQDFPVGVTPEMEGKPTSGSANEDWFLAS